MTSDDLTGQPSSADAMRWATALTQIEDRRAELDAEVEHATEGATAALREYGRRCLEAGVPVDRDVVRHFYWEQPGIRVRDIGEALGLGNVHDVIAAAGPGRFERPCRGSCGTIVTRTLTSRTDGKNAGRYSKWIDPRYCSNCQQRELELYETKAAERDARFSRQHNAEIEEAERAIADGARVVRRYVEYEGIGGTWTDPEFAAQ